MEFKSKIIRNPIIVDEPSINCFLPLSDDFLLLALNNGKFELWDTNEDMFKSITLYSQKDNIDNIVVQLETIYSNPKTLNTKFVALTQKGDVFIIKV